MERVIPSVFTRSRKKTVNQNNTTNAVLGRFHEQNASQTKALGNTIISEFVFESKIATTIEKQSFRSV